jgi:hypothetical protein
MRVENFQNGMELESLAHMPFNWRRKFPPKCGDIICLLIDPKSLIANLAGEILLIKIIINFWPIWEILSTEYYNLSMHITKKKFQF